MLPALLVRLRCQTELLQMLQFAQVGRSMDVDLAQGKGNEDTWQGCEEMLHEEVSKWG